MSLGPLLLELGDFSNVFAKKKNNFRPISVTIIANASPAHSSNAIKMAAQKAKRAMPITVIRKFYPSYFQPRYKSAFRKTFKFYLPT